MASVPRYRSLAATTIAGGARAAASMMRHLGIRLALMLVLLAIACVGGAVAAAPTTTVKVAAVAFDPAWGDVDGNIARMVAGIEDVAKQGVRLAVLPETATIGYIFDNFAMVKPYLDTVPGKATAAIEKVTRAYQMYVAVGIAEIDPASGLGYNTAALIGPERLYRQVSQARAQCAGSALGNRRRSRLPGIRYRAWAHLAADLLRRHLLAIRPSGCAARCRHHRLVERVGPGDARHATGAGQGRPLHGGECAIPVGASAVRG